MDNFTFWSPTKMIFGKGVENRSGELAKEFGASKVLLHFGGGSAEKSGLLNRIRKSLSESSLKFVELAGAQPNPRLGLVRVGAELCKKNGVDFILAVGGGSVIDSAKAIALSAANPETDVWDFYSRKALPSGAIGVGCVPTLPAAGSEMSNSSVITNEDGMLKRGFTSKLICCKFAAMNPELTFTLPPYQTQCGCADIMMHTMERYFCGDFDRKLLDGFAESLMRTLMEAAQKLKENPFDYNARAETMLAAAMSHNDVTGSRDNGDWACHQLEHELSGKFDVPHGAGLTAIWPAWARYVYRKNIPRFAQFASNVFGCAIDFNNIEHTALKGIEAYEKFWESQGMPINMPQLGINLDEGAIKELAEKCSFGNTRTIGKIAKLDISDMESIYRSA